MPQITTGPAPATINTFVDLTINDLDAVAVHIQNLDPADRQLRFGSGVDSHSMESARLKARAMLQSPNVTTFGLWDAAHERLLVVGCYGPVPQKPGTVETGASALREVRGGMSQRISEWLHPRLVAEGFKRIEWMFYQQNARVAAIAKKWGLSVSCYQGECHACIDLQPTANAIKDWLDRLDQLLEAVRNDPPDGAGAKL
jgi:hypothetical protein